MNGITTRSRTDAPKISAPLNANVGRINGAREIMRRILLSTLLLATFLSPNAYSDDSASLLAGLKSELHRIRTTTSDKPVNIDALPDVSSIVGMKVDELSMLLGEPDSSSEKSVIYHFYYLPITYVGGGPMLIIGLDHNGTITNAQWMGSL